MNGSQSYSNWYSKTQFAHVCQLRIFVFKNDDLCEWIEFDSASEYSSDSKWPKKRILFTSLWTVRRIRARSLIETDDWCVQSFFICSTFKVRKLNKLFSGFEADNEKND